MTVVRRGERRSHGVTYHRAIKQAPGHLILLSGPAGVGKKSILDKLFQSGELQDNVVIAKSRHTLPVEPPKNPIAKLFDRMKPALNMIVNQISWMMVNAPLPGFFRIKDPIETDPYYLPEEAFLKMKDQNQLLQWRQTKQGWQGLPLKSVLSSLNEGFVVIAEMFTRDALRLKRFYPEKVTTVFIAPSHPTQNTLKTRLEKQGRSLKEIKQRLLVALFEMKLMPLFDVTIFNKEKQLQHSVDALKQVILRYANVASPVEKKAS